MASKIHVGDIGTQLVMTVKDDDVVVDISSATDLEIFIKKPNGISYEKTGVFYTDGTDGKMYYTSVTGDFNAAGNYKLQGRVSLPGGTYYTSINDFKVHCNL